MTYLDVAEFVDYDIIKAGKWHFNQVEGKRNPFGFVRIATPTSFHGSDGDRWQWNLFCLHQVMAIN